MWCLFNQTSPSGEVARSSPSWKESSLLCRTQRGSTCQVLQSLLAYCRRNKLLSHTTPVKVNPQRSGGPEISSQLQNFNKPRTNSESTSGRYLWEIEMSETHTTKTFREGTASLQQTPFYILFIRDSLHTVRLTNNSVQAKDSDRYSYWDYLSIVFWNSSFVNGSFFSLFEDSLFHNTRCMTGTCVQTFTHTGGHKSIKTHALHRCSVKSKLLP